MLLFFLQISRQSIDAVKDYFRDDMGKSDWQLIMELKKTFQILWELRERQNCCWKLKQIFFCN